LACKNASLSYVVRFGDKAAEQAAKAAKIKGGDTPSRPLVSKAPIGNTSLVPPALKGTNIALGSTSSPTNQKVDNKLKGTVGIEDKDVLVDPNNSDKKLRISMGLNPKCEFTLIKFFRDNLDVFIWKILDMPKILREVIKHKLSIDPSYKSIK
jgi:hypothetical protein